MRMIRTERWKMILHLNAQPQHELYDLSADVGELTNVYGQPGNADTIRELTKRLRDQMAKIGDPRLTELP
jgi:arylsulfatase A-like enzyme